MYKLILNKEGRFIRLACIVLVLALEMVGFALAENVADEERVDNGTMDLVTTLQGSLFTEDQSVAGNGFANVNNNYAVVNPDGSQVLNLKDLRSGSGSYSHDTSISVQNAVVATSGENFASSNYKITSKEDTSAAYAGINFQIPGSFRAKTIKSLWKDQTCAKNYIGIISMDSLFDYAKTLNKESTTDMYSDLTTYEGLVESESSSVGSSMGINSQFDGVAHLGATINDVRGESLTMKAKPDSAVLMDEDYKGSFNLSKNMAITIKKTIDYGDVDVEGAEDYPWLPCACNAGWDDMAIHDQRYHSAKEFFNCTTCLPPGLCKN